MYQSPRIRRLRNDLAALERLRAESSVFRFSAQGDPPHHYVISFQGRGLWRDRGKVRVSEIHRVEIKLGASYPRTMPEIRWITPVYHPNISEIGMVCLGGYGTNWVPSVQLDELCTMLWDMARYHNYDIRSPYNRDSALWVASQTAFLFPIDQRSLRDLRAAQGRAGATSGDAADGPGGQPKAASNGNGRSRRRRGGAASETAVTRVSRLIQRYRRAFAGEADDAEPQTGATPVPASPELQALASAEAASLSIAPPARLQSEDLVILESSNLDNPPISQDPSGRDEIVFIE
jgi:ubiquitin-protein ligase